MTPSSNSVKRHHSHKKRSFSNVEYPDVTSNIVGLGTTPSKSKWKHLDISSGEFGVELSSDLKEILIAPEGIYQHT